MNVCCDHHIRSSRVSRRPVACLLHGGRLSKQPLHKDSILRLYIRSYLYIKFIIFLLVYKPRRPRGPRATSKIETYDLFAGIPPEAFAGVLSHITLFIYIYKGDPCWLYNSSLLPFVRIYDARQHIVQTWCMTFGIFLFYSLSFFQWLSVISYKCVCDVSVLYRQLEYWHILYIYICIDECRAELG